MKLFIDCEWNDWRGDLISMALVDENEMYWYYSLGCENPSRWVAANVMPHLNVKPVSRPEMQNALYHFLSLYPSGVHVIADWPEDIQHFCALLMMKGGERIATPPLTMEIRRDIGSDKSKTPHNALADAFALRDEWLALPRRSMSRAPK